MARSEGRVSYLAFNRGIMTEASPLNFPQEFCIADYNCVGLTTGVKERRKGIDFEENYTLSADTEDLDDIGVTKAVNTFIWKTAGNVIDNDFLCVQFGTDIYFYEVNKYPISSFKKDFTIDLTSYLDAGVVNSYQKVTFSNRDGDLILCNKNMKPLEVTYDTVADSISIEEYTIKVLKYSVFEPELDPGSADKGDTYYSFNIEDIEEQPNKRIDAFGRSFYITGGNKIYFSVASLKDNINLMNLE